MRLLGGLNETVQAEGSAEWQGRVSCLLNAASVIIGRAVQEVLGDRELSLSLLSSLYLTALSQPLAPLDVPIILVR